MTPGTWTRMLAAAALVALLAPGGSVGQEPETRRPGERRLAPGMIGPGMVLDEDGGWRPPTLADAIGALRGDPDVALPVGVQRFDPALAVLRQEYGPRPAAELDELAKALADLILASDPENTSEEADVQFEAFSVLATAARGGRGPPHPGSFDELVRVYETIVAEALAGGGTDPVVELVRRRPGGAARLWSALRSILNADRTGRGADYLLAIVAASEPPDPQRDNWYEFPHSLWCVAANILRDGGGRPPEENPRRAELPDSALDDETFYLLCELH